MTQPDSVGDPKTREYWEERFEQLKYLKAKIDWLHKKLREEREDFPDFISEWLEENNAEAYIRSQIDPQEFENGSKFYQETEINKIQQSFSYMLETYMIERKRLVEHSLKLVRDFANQNKRDSTFSVGTFISGAEDTVKGKMDRESWYEIVRTYDPLFFNQILEQKEFITHVRDNRTNLTHFQAEVDKDIFLRFDYAEIKRNQLVIKRPKTVEEYTVELGDMSLDEFLEKDEKNFDALVSRCQVAFNRISMGSRIGEVVAASETGFIEWEEILEQVE